MPVTDEQVEAGAIAWFAANNADGNVELVSERWPGYSDVQKDFYRKFARIVLEAAAAAA